MVTIDSNYCGSGVPPPFRTKQLHPNQNDHCACYVFFGPQCDPIAPPERIKRIVSSTDTNPIPRPLEGRLPYFAPGHTPSRQDNAIYLLDILRFLFKYKWIISGVTLLSTALATAIALKMTPIYRAEVLIAPASEEQAKSGLSALANQFGGIASLTGVDLGGGGSRSEAIATLKSRAFTEKFVTDEGLLPILFEDQWDHENNRWNESDPAKLPSMWNTFKVFDGIRTVSDDKKTGLITLGIEWKDPTLAARWANLMVARINKILRERAIDQAQRSIDYLKRELAKTGVVELQQGIYRLIEGQVNKIMLANVRDDYAFKIVDPAVVPMERFRPKRRAIVLLGCMAGLIFGTFVALAYSTLNRLRSRKE